MGLLRHILGRLFPLVLAGLLAKAQIVTLTLSFCERCGTTCFKTADNMEGVVIVLAGTLDGGGLEQAKPEAELLEQAQG